MIIRKIFFLLIFVVFSSWALVGTRDDGPMYYGIRHNGMGNTSIAIVDDRYSLFNNPAGLDLFGEHVELSIAPISLHINQTFYEIASFLLKHQAQLKDPGLYDKPFFDNFSAIDAQWAKIGYLPEATLVFQHFGVGAYNVLSTKISAETGHFIPKIQLAGNQDFVLTAGYGGRLLKTLSVGVTVKYIYRVVLPDTCFGFTDTYAASKELTDGIAGGNLTAFSKWAHLERGVGFDVGSMLHMGATKFGLTIQDLAEYLDGKRKHTRISLGVSHRFLSLLELPFVKDIVVGMDIKDITGKDNFFNKLHLGSELDLHAIALRCGINQGYPTFGVSLSLAILHFEYAYTTEEWGYYPGQAPNPAHIFSSRLGFKF